MEIANVVEKCSGIVKEVTIGATKDEVVPGLRL
jgi:hypothetical protein